MHGIPEGGEDFRERAKLTGRIPMLASRKIMGQSRAGLGYSTDLSFGMPNFS
jgi:hypothetical protein